MAAPHLELFFFPQCPYCQLVLESIDDMDLQVDMLDTRKDDRNHKRLVKDTGKGTVPCLYVDNRPMHESRDIVAWLEKNQDKLKKRD
jgi:glutaredoxin 3